MTKSLLLTVLPLVHELIYSYVAMYMTIFPITSIQLLTTASEVGKLQEDLEEMKPQLEQAQVQGK